MLGSRRWLAKFGGCLTLAAAFAAVPAAAGDYFVFIGTQGRAILSARLDSDAGTIASVAPAAAIARPTWIDIDPERPLLFAVSEIGNYDAEPGQVASFAIDPASGALTPVSLIESGGNGPTHLSYSPKSATLFVAHFGRGQVAALPVSEEGVIGAPAAIVINEGSGPHAKQKGPHAHQVVLSPDGRTLLVPDMGADRIFLWKFDPRTRALQAGDPAAQHVPPAAGPRHLAIAPDGRHLYLVTEISAEIRAFRLKKSGARLVPFQTLALDAGVSDTTGADGKPVPQRRNASEIVISADGRFIYASNRARNLIQVYARDRRNGRLTHVQDVPSGGDTPRSFAIAPGGRWLLVGNQASLTVQIFAVDPVSGRLTAHGGPVAMPDKPVSFAFFPQTP